MSLLAELKRRNVIRVAAGYIVGAWLVVQVVETIFPAFGFGDEAVRFVVIAFAVAFIPVVVLTWVFEWTPEGIRKDDGEDQHGPAASAAARRWDRIVMVVLALAVTFFIIEKILDVPVDLEPAVAVLPFDGIGADPDLEYLSAGVAEGVHASLASIPDLVVSAWRTTVELSGEGLEPAAIAEQLDAPNFLEGSVQIAGDAVEVTARLVDAGSGRTVWTDTYDGSVADIFAIQDDIARSLLEHLVPGSPDAPQKAQRTNPDTYRLTKQAWSVLRRESQARTGATAAGLLEEALALDPDYVPALNALSYAVFQQAQDGDISRKEAEAAYEDIKERVLAIDSGNAVANVYLAWELFWDRREVAHANQHLQIAMRTGLNDLEVLRVLAGFARRTGNVDAALWFGERALAVDPTCENCQWQRSENLFYAGLYEEAIEEKKRLQKVIMGGHANHAFMLLEIGEPQAALDVIAQSSEPERLAGLAAMAYFALGEQDKYSGTMQEFRELDDPMLDMSLAQVHAFTGDKERAFEALGNLAAQSPERLQAHLFLPWWQNLRDDPRWPALRERLDMTEERLSSLDFSSVLSEIRMPPDGLREERT